MFKNTQRKKKAEGKDFKKIKNRMLKHLLIIYTICNLKLIDFSFSLIFFYFTKLFKTILVPISSDNYEWNLKKLWLVNRL